jgi:thiamine-phosphate pyrophosphorylase
MALERPWRGLYAITPESADTPTLLARVARCLEGGAAMLQYRAKALPAGTALAQAHGIAALCRRHGVPFIVNDSISLATAVRADGVHLGRDDAGVREARIAMPRGIIGVSCYDRPERAAVAAHEGADYVAIGSVFASPTKPAAVRAPLAALAEARQRSGLPVVAIGGITAENAPEAIAAGADLLAVISAIFDTADPAQASRRFAALFTAAHGEPDVRTQPRAV